eukprot:14164042-Heterocapsa_arctica.AAC.1
MDTAEVSLSSAGDRNTEKKVSASCPTISERFLPLEEEDAAGIARVVDLVGARSLFSLPLDLFCASLE